MDSSKAQIDGLWWLPGQHGERWVGSLSRMDGESHRLKFTVPEGNCRRVPDSPEGIHGVDSNNRPITLLFVGRTNCCRSAAFTTYEFSAGYTVRGVHLENAAALKLNQALIRLEYLHDWIGRTGFDRSPRKGSDLNMRYELPKDLSFELGTDLQLDIMTQARSNEGGRAYDIEESTGIRLRFKNGAGFQEIIDWISSLRGLLHFSILRPVHLIHVSGRQDGHGRTHGDIFLPYEIEIISSMNRSEVVERFTHASDFTFCFADVQAKFADFMQEWMKYEARFENALGCYYTTVYQSQVSSEEFLSLTRALDAYWGIKYNQRDDNDFPKKIRELITAHQSRLFGRVPDIDAFVDGVRATRHHHTHYGTRWEASGNVVSGVALRRLNIDLKILFQVCVLTDLKIPPTRFGCLKRQYPDRIIEYKVRT